MCCALPCASSPCPFHSACGRIINDRIPLCEDTHTSHYTRPPKYCGLIINSAAAQVHQRAFWSTPQKVAGTYATLLACMHLGSMPHRSNKFWGRAFSFSPDGLSEEMGLQKTARPSAHTSCQALWAYVLQLPPNLHPGTTAQAKPELGLPSSKDRSSRAHVNDLRFQLRSHPALPPCPRRSVANQRPGCPVPECILLRSWVDPFSCPLPKPPCRPWPRSLALQSHISQDRTDQVRSLLSPQITVMPLRRVFGARPALPRPYGPVRPLEPSSTAQLQATLKDKCTAEWVLILKSCVASSMLAQALEARSTRRSLSKHLCGNFRGARCRSTPRHPPFSHLRKSVRG